MAEQEKRSKASVADKISDLIEAIRETKSDVKGSEVPLSTGEQLRKLFPSIPPHNCNTSSDIRNIHNSSRKGIEHFLERSSSGKRPSGNKRAKETSTMTASLKDVFFLMDMRNGIPKYEKRTRLVEEGFVKSAVRFTSDMDEEAIFSTIRDQFDTKFDGNVPPFKILKAYLSSQTWIAVGTTRYSSNSVATARFMCVQKVLLPVLTQKGKLKIYRNQKS